MRQSATLHDINAEKLIIAGIFQDTSLLDQVTNYVHSSDFENSVNQKIFESVCSLYANNEPIDAFSVYSNLRKRFSENKLGNMSREYLESISGVFTSQDMVISACKSVREYSIRRELFRISSDLHSASIDMASDYATVLGKAQQTILSLDLDYSNKNLQHIKEIAERVCQEIAERSKKGKFVSKGIYTGIKGIDNMLGGFKKGDFIIIGARPSVGKTSIALNMASNMSENGKKVGFFSLEMDADKLVNRIISSRVNIDNFKLQNSVLEADDVNKVFGVRKEFDNETFYIEDTANLNLFKLISQARTLRKQHEIDILFIDYIGLIGTEMKGTPRHEQVSIISRSIKALTRELQIPIVTLCQLTRDSENHEPHLANLRDSGSIEQDADVVIFLHKTGDVDDNNTLPIKLKVAKHRNGKTGSLEFDFNVSTVKFKETNKEKE